MDRSLSIENKGFLKNFRDRTFAFILLKKIIDLFTNVCGIVDKIPIEG